MFYILVLAACALLASAKTVTYNFDVGWVTVSSFVHAVSSMLLIVYRLLQMVTRDR
jgi:hypothetical protein